MQTIARYAKSDFGKSTHLYMEQFKNLIDYIGFKELIDSSFYQSEHFESILNFSSNKTETLEAKGILMSHTTMARDSTFNAKF